MMKFKSIEEQIATRDAEKFFAEAEQAIAAGYDEHANRMLSLFIDARAHSGEASDWTPSR